NEETCTDGFDEVVDGDMKADVCARVEAVKESYDIMFFPERLFLYNIKFITSQSQYLELSCSRKEIKHAVWDCGGEHARGPDGFTFKFITSFWDMLEADVVRSEVIAWYHKRKQKLMVFKVDFEKAFDSIRWDFLDLVIAKLGFAFKLRSWIHRCLRNAGSSVLINRSPTSVFKIFRGLRQGDLLSSFLFILAMEARLLSINGRLSLIKSVLRNLPTYHMSIYMMHVTIQKKLETMRNNFFIGGDKSEKKISWVSWKKCLASKKLGGLGVRSKWWWQIRIEHEAIWVKVVKSIYGVYGVMGDFVGMFSVRREFRGIL
nr:hypothetical protein [Tanacetum cinerariifolium]